MLTKTIVTALFLCVACSDGLADDEPVVPGQAVLNTTEVAVAQDADAEARPARVAGTITFEGEIPAKEDVDLSPDPFCAEHHADSGMKTPGGVRTGEGGGLADVFVQLTSGVPDEKYEVPEEPVVLDQKGCTYDPHVFGVMKKQVIKILNSDATLHNIHAMPKSNKEFNLAMPNKDDVREQKFKKAEDAVVIKCDVHPWMKCYAFVLEHPYFATTDANGKFEIDLTGLADGEYGVKIWHESLGENEGTVTVADGAGSFDFKFESEKGE